MSEKASKAIDLVSDQWELVTGLSSWCYFLVQCLPYVQCRIHWTSVTTLVCNQLGQVISLKHLFGFETSDRHPHHDDAGTCTNWAGRNKLIFVSFVWFTIYVCISWLWIAERSQLILLWVVTEKKSRYWKLLNSTYVSGCGESKKA